jgi:Rho-binding antiterminator
MLKYIPIDCNYYDRLEEAATRRQIVTLRYREGAEEKTVQGRITDLQIKEGAEWLLLEQGFWLRLDNLIAMDQWVVPGVQDPLQRSS